MTGAHEHSTLRCLRMLTECVRSSLLPDDLFGLSLGIDQAGFTRGPSGLRAAPSLVILFSQLLACCHAPRSIWGRLTCLFEVEMVGSNVIVRASVLEHIEQGAQSLPSASCDFPLE